MTDMATELYRPTIQKVHVVHDDTKQQSPQKPREYVATLNTYPLILGALPQLILPHAPKRCRATVSVNGNGIVVFGRTMSDCQSAITNVTSISELTGNVYSAYGAGVSEPMTWKTTSAIYAALYASSFPAQSLVYPTITQPAVPATGVVQQNLNNAPVTVVISANGATITNVTVNGITVGTTAGTYIVPAAGTISIAYTVAVPTWVWTLTQAPVITQNPNPTSVSVEQEIAA